jgi:hypothetical protein
MLSLRFAFEIRPEGRHSVRVQRLLIFGFWSAALFFATALNLAAQGTAISYQGRLFDAGAPANTNYDLRFAVYDAVTNGNKLSVYVTNSAVPVSNGLFSVTLDFGAGVFNGTANGSNDWLDVSVRAIGAASFTALTPRQPILPVPYALFASSASNLLGRVPSSLFSGSYSNAVNFVNGTNTFAGAFSGNGASLTNLNGSNISQGTVADARLSTNVDLLNAAQTITGAKTFTNITAFAGPVTLASTNTFTGPIASSATNTFTGANTFNNLGNNFSGSFFGNGLVGWIGTNSTAFTAQFDHGYLLTNSQLVTVTLPTSINVGDIVRIAGAGGGGWLVKASAGQTIVGNFASFANGVLAQISSSDCYGVAGSADGVRIYDSPYGGGIYPYTAGLGWNAAGSFTGTAYYSLACSANGKIVYAEPIGSGSIIKSTDGGVTWPGTAGTANGTAISCTADGATLFTGNVACSGNGKYIAKWSGTTITISNFTAGVSATVTAPATPKCLAVSSDCTKIVFGVNNGLLYASSDQGRSWTTLTTANQLWSCAWMSPDGSHFAAAVNTTGTGSGGVYYCDVSTQPNTSTVSAGNICGSRGSAVELQYIGGGVFMPVSSVGLIWAN